MKKYHGSQKAVKNSFAAYKILHVEKCKTKLQSNKVNLKNYFGVDCSFSVQVKINIFLCEIKINQLFLHLKWAFFLLSI